MDGLTIGDIAQNPVQHAIVRWFGVIEEIPIIGLQLIDSVLPGYTDGICPFDNKRYFNCPDGQGYYILESSFTNSYTIIQKEIETNQFTTSDNEFDSATESLSTSPANRSTTPQPIPSFFSPSVSQIQHDLDNKNVISPPRGILSRLAFEREQRKTQTTSSSAENKNSFIHTSSIEAESPSSSSSSRIYHPENYTSRSYDKTEESEIYEFTAYDNSNENKTNYPLSQTTNNNNEQSSSMHSLPCFGQEYFLDTWTLGQVKFLLENQIPVDNQLCLNISNDQCNVQNLVDEQINQCLSIIPAKPPDNIRIELIKLFDHVTYIFPSRTIRLYNNDYLLLAILCSNNQCAYIRTSSGWAYAGDECDHKQSIVIDEISQMIDDSNSKIRKSSELCLYVLKNACFLYYKLVE